MASGIVDSPILTHPGSSPRLLFGRLPPRHLPPVPSPSTRPHLGNLPLRHATSSVPRMAPLPSPSLCTRITSPSYPDSASFSSINDPPRTTPRHSAPLSLFLSLTGTLPPARPPAPDILQTRVEHTAVSSITTQPKPGRAPPQEAAHRGRVEPVERSDRTAASPACSTEADATRPVGGAGPGGEGGRRGLGSVLTFSSASLVQIVHVLCFNLSCPAIGGK